VRARRSVWSNDEVAKLLKDFVPCADEVWRLQNSKDPDATFFMSWCDEGGQLNGDDDSATRQGTYICTPSGEFLGSANSNDSGRILQLMRDALAKYKKMEKKERLRDDDPKEIAKQIKRSESMYPADGLVLRCHSRDLPREKPVAAEEWAQKALNVDYCWFKKEEGLKFMPKEPVKKLEFDVPKDLVTRMARFNMVDNVRGQTDNYNAGAVKTAELKGTVKDIKKGIVYITFAGSVKLEQDTRGMDLKLLGEAEWDMKKNWWTKFEIVCAGERKGRSRYNFRERDEGPAPIGFVFVLAGDSPTDKVAPAFFWEYGWR
jgi:hypothetical protein